MEAARMDISNIDMSTPFTKMVDEDIQKCEALLNDSYNEAECESTGIPEGRNRRSFPGTIFRYLVRLWKKVPD